MECSKTTSEMIQGVVITFDDGATATFTGPAVCFDGDKRKISDIYFTEPKPLPAGCSWVAVNDERR